MRFTLYRFHCSIVVFCWVIKHILYLLRDAKIITEIHHFEKKILLSTQNNSKLLYFQEVELFTNSLNQLKHAQGKFVESQESMNKISPESQNKDILVPLTGSVSFLF